MKKLPVVLLITSVALVTGLLLGTESQSSASRETTQLVPLAFANEWGAEQWDGARLEQFLKDRSNAIRLYREEIVARNARGPTEWLPDSGRCDYIGKFMAVMERYELHHRHEQWQNLLVKRQRCYTQFQ